jgi:integrase
VDARTKSGGERKEFDTRQEAETFAQQQRVKRQNEGSDAFAMNPAERIDAENALKLLRPLGRSLMEAVLFYQNHLPATEGGKSVADVVAALLGAKEKDGASDRYLKDIRTRLGHFAESFPEKLIAGVTTAGIDDWLRALPHGPVTRNNYRRLLSVLFSYAKQRRYCVANPVQETAKAKVVRGRPGILSAEQVKGLLAAAEDELRPAIAIGLFAGLRPESEIWRLDWSKVDFAAKHIDVSAEATKNRGDGTEGAAHRFVTMQPNLIAWLKPLARKQGPVSRTGDRDLTLLDAARKKAGITEWPHDAMRYTFGSMHYAHFQNVGATMAEMGHTNPKTFFGHYRARVRPAEAAAFWKISPVSGGR